MHKNSPIRSFGRVRCNKLSPAQEALIADVLPKLSPDTTTLNNKIWLEIGFGAGEHLIQLINERTSDDITIIGCEPYVNGTVKAVKYIFDNQIQNVFIYDNDARGIIKQLPCDSVERFYVLFPDPWPKKRHNKRRIINNETIELLLSKSTKDGVVTIATDHEQYADHISELLVDYNNKKLQLSTSEDCSAAGVLTRYCQKALQKGLKINLFKVFKDV